MTTLYVTTSVNADAALEDDARAIAAELGASYARRRNVTLTRLFSEYPADRLLIVGHDRYSLRDRETGATYHFHPNLAMLRGLNVRRGWRDLFLEATALAEGESILDCTVGFAGEATLASLAVGEGGRVVGLESVPELAAVTRHGVRTFELNPKFLRTALRRVEIVTADYRRYLPDCPTASFDVVYFDPFFGERLSGSENSVSPLAFFGNASPLHVPSVIEARRVARRRVVVKSPRRDDLPAELDPLVDAVVTGRKSRVVYHIFPSDLSRAMLLEKHADLDNKG